MIITHLQLGKQGQIRVWAHTQQWKLKLTTLKEICGQIKDVVMQTLNYTMCPTTNVLCPLVQYK